tara:strand:+ start:2294 stop:2431 length:138 start_codon:yes stop_codon:yes gene_type:complete
METDANLSYLCIAYTIVWIILFAYILTLKKRTKALYKELRDLASS